jgi:hypothetical protein
MNVIGRCRLQKHCFGAGAITVQGGAVSKARGHIHACHVGEIEDNAKPDRNSLFAAMRHVRGPH